jgi:uncharacterized metal-binding protein
MSNCLCEPSDIMLFSCSGAANVGQISNEATIQISKEGKGKMFCLAGLGGKIPGIIEATKKAKKIIVIDGCPVSCAKKIVDNVGFKIDDYILITENGIDKTPGNSNFTNEEVEKIKLLIESKIDSILKN